MSKELIGDVFELDGFTKFERTRIIGARALQLSVGAPLLVEPDKSTNDPLELSKMEFEEGVVPITIRRQMPKRLD